MAANVAEAPSQQSPSYLRHRADSLTAESTSTTSGVQRASHATAGASASDTGYGSYTRAAMAMRQSRKQNGVASPTPMPSASPADASEADSLGSSRIPPSARSSGTNGQSSPHLGSGPGAALSAERERVGTADETVASQTSEAGSSPRPPAAAVPTVAPSIKVKPEYQTIYRKDPSGVQGKQNVVCVITIELPSRRPRNAADGRPPPHSQSRLAAASESAKHSSMAGQAGYPRGRGINEHAYPADHRSDGDEYENIIDKHGRAAPRYPMGAPGPGALARSPSLRSNSMSNEDRNSHVPIRNAQHGGSGSEGGFQSSYGRSDEKLAGPKESVPTLNSSDEDAPFSFGATPAVGATTADQVLTAVVEDLRLRVNDWKGEGLEEFGPLLAFGCLTVRQTTTVRSFHVFLFRNVLICIGEEKKKGLSRFISGAAPSTPTGPATGAPVTDQTLSTLVANASHAPALKLKGRIYLRHIRKIVCSPPKVEQTINIKLDDDSLDQFVLVFDTREQMNQWAKLILGLLSANALARSTVYDPSLSGMRAASEPGRPTPGLGIDFTPGGGNGFPAASAVVPPSSSAALYSSPSNASRRADSMQRRPAGYANSTSIPPNATATPLSHAPMSPASVGGRARSRSPGAYSRTSSYLTDRKTLPGRPQPPTAEPIVTVSVEDAPYARWSSSGGFNPSLPPPPLLPHSPIDLVVMVSVPLPTSRFAGASSSSATSTASLKLRVIRATLELIISSMGPRDRLAVVTYTVGQNGQVRRTALLNSHKPRSVQKFQQFVHSLDHGWDPQEEDPFLEDVSRDPALGGADSPQVDSASAINIGLDIMIQRKSKNPVSGILLISDTIDTPRRGNMDFLLGRVEAANVPIHTFGFGKSHDAQTLFQLSNQTRGLYTFVREWDQLQECLLGCIGSLMSVALVDFKVHIGVPSDNHFRVRKISGPTSAVISANGKEVGINIGDLRYGDRKEIFVELEFDFNALIPFVTEVLRDGRKVLRGLPHTLVEEHSATDEFLQRLGIQGLSLNDCVTHEIAPTPMIEDVAVLDVGASYRDTTSSRTPYQTPHPTVLTLEVDATSPDPLSEASPGTVAVLADPNVTRRRIEILVSEMISRSLYLASRQNDRQALAVLSETRRIVEIVVQAMSGQDRQAAAVSSQRRVRKPREFASMTTIDTFYGILEDLDLLLDGLEHSRHHFDRDLRNYAAQQAMILRDQKAWTTRTLLEYMHFQDDNGPALTAHGAILARTSVRQ